MTFEHSADLESSSPKGDLEDRASDVSLSIIFDPHGNPVVPQPSKDPHDPLNFPFWLKCCVLFSLAYWALLGTMNLIVVGPSFFELHENYEVSFTALSYTINGPLLAYGFGCMFWVPFSNVWGIKATFFISAVGAGALSVWAALAPTFAQFVTARVLASIFFSSPEALGPQVVADVFFLHQRATATGVFTYFQFVGFSIATLIGGFGADGQGWRAPSWIMAALAFGCALCVFLLMPETTYTRAGRCSNKDKRKWTHTMKLWSASGGGSSKISRPWKAFITPWPFALQPVVLCNTCILSLLLATNDYMITTGNTSFTRVYDFTLAETSLTAVAPTIGTTLGIIYGGYCNDLFVSWHRKRNGGIFVPEMRLPMLLTSAVLGPAGMIMFGCATEYDAHWMIPLVGETLMAFMIAVCGNIVYAYIVDTYMERADGALMILNSLKNIPAFVLVYAVNPWNTTSGYAVAFGCLAVIIVISHSPMLLLYLKGDSIRSWQRRRFASARVASAGD